MEAGEKFATPVLDQMTVPVGEEPDTVAEHVVVEFSGTFAFEQVTEVLVAMPVDEVRTGGGLLTVHVVISPPGGEEHGVTTETSGLGAANENSGITPFGAIARTLTHCQNSVP